jgi:hypothetical protein
MESATDVSESAIAFLAAVKPGIGFMPKAIPFSWSPSKLPPPATMSAFPGQ